MSILKKATLSASLLLAAGLFAVTPAHASFVFASSDMKIYNLSFSSTDPAAQLDWTDVWFGTVTAHAQDTDSGSADDHQELLGNDGSIEAIANTAHVHSKAPIA